MCGHSGDESDQVARTNQSVTSNIEKAYICIFFDGTSNNMYEQLNKGNLLKERLAKASTEHPTTTMFSISPTLFSLSGYAADDIIIREAVKNNYDISQYGMTHYFEQKEQAEQDYKIAENRGDKNSKKIEDNGGLKYSNVAILRSLTKKKPKQPTDGSDGKVCINYNLYIEGSGNEWDKGKDIVGIGMGTGRTGVCGLVSKAMVFVQEYLDSQIMDAANRQTVELHFALFGFSRGATCGRVFTYLVTENQNTLPKINEFRQYLPDHYYKGAKLCFLDEYNNKTVDYLGIYDTVASIGFLQKDDNSTNCGVNQFVHFETDESGKEWYVNAFHGPGFNTQDVQVLFPNPAVAISEVVSGGLKAVTAAGTKLFWGDAKWTFHRNNVTDYGLYSHQNAKHTFHICAMDEFRENFALVNLGSKLDRCAEVFMPGCHTDIGGGYMKYDDIDRYTLRRKINGKPTRLNVSCDPRNVVPSRELSREVMVEEGWLQQPNPVLTNPVPTALLPGKSRMQELSRLFAAASDPEGIAYARLKTKELEREEGMKESKRGMTCWSDESDNKIEFERFVLEGYSNITLEMMKTRAMGKMGLGWPEPFLPFNDGLPPRFQVSGFLKEIRDKWLKIDVSKIEEGITTWFIPEKEQYKRLRKDYLHFTCTDELNAEKWHWNAFGANLGNAPCWKGMVDYYLLTRLVYNGDKDDNGLHYIYEYLPHKKRGHRK